MTPVYALALDSNDVLYAGGKFYQHHQRDGGEPYRPV